MLRCAECERPLQFAIWGDELDEAICYDCWADFYPHHAANTLKPKPQNIIAWECGCNFGYSADTVKEAWHRAHSLIRQTLRGGFYPKAYEPYSRITWQTLGIPFTATVYADSTTFLDCNLDDNEEA